MSSYLDTLEKLPPEIIQSFRETNESAVIPPEIQQYIRELNTALEISRFTFSVSRAAKQIILRHPGMSVSTAKSRLYDAINFFHVDCNVSEEAWNAKYADWYDDFADHCLVAKKYDTALRAKTLAQDTRSRVNTGFKPADFKAPVLIVSNTLTPEDFGYESKNLHNIATKYQEGKYELFIERLEVSDEEKKRLKKDAGIKDVDYEEIKE